MINLVFIHSSIHLPNGEIVTISQKGNVRLTSDVLLYYVLYIPTFKFNLISISIHTTDSTCCVQFLPTMCLFLDLVTKILKGIGKPDCGLYKFVTAGGSTVLQVSSSYTLWHSRLGHPSYTVLTKIPSIKCNKDCSSIPRDVCHFAKQSRQPFPTSVTHTIGIFEPVHCNVWGPYNYPTHDGYTYFLTLVDDYSKCTWTCLMHSKSQVFVFLQSFFKYVHTQFGCLVKFLIPINKLSRILIGVKQWLLKYKL